MARHLRNLPGAELRKDALGQSLTLALETCDLFVDIDPRIVAARLNLGPEWSVRPSRELRDKLSELLGANNVRLLYAPGREIM